MTGGTNAICWDRKLDGDFGEILQNLESKDNITEVTTEELQDLNLGPAGNAARQILLRDFNLLKAHGSDPVLNIIRYYEKDAQAEFFPTDVYSWHADRSPFANDTYLCTYYGEPSEILPNEQAQKKILQPEIRAELKRQFDGSAGNFEDFLSEHFYDLHYIALPNAIPVSLGVGNMWRLATDNPESLVPPRIHRAPAETSGKSRLLMIC